MSVTFPRNGYSTEEQKFLSLKFLLLLFFFLIYWIAVEAILLLVSAMIKPFELIKVSFVYTVPNARNTRRSTALGETPSYLVLCQIPRTVQSRCGFSVGCGCGTQRGSVHRSCTLFHSSVQFVASTLQKLFLPLCKVFPTVSRGIGSLEGIQIMKRGLRGEEGSKGVLSSFCCKKQQWKKRDRSFMRNQLQWTSGVDGSQVSGVYCTMNCQAKVKIGSFLPPLPEKLADHTKRWASQRTTIKKGQRWPDENLQVSMIGCHWTQRVMYDNGDTTISAYRTWRISKIALGSESSRKNKRKMKSWAIPLRRQIK